MSNTTLERPPNCRPLQDTLPLKLHLPLPWDQFNSWARVYAQALEYERRQKRKKL